MLNIFKTKESSEKTVTISKYAPEIKQIHNEFNIAEETLLKEALSVLEDCKTKDLAKGELLASLGFIQTPQAKAVEEIKTKKILAEQTAKVIQKYSFKYPNNKFITEDMVEEICKKYNLVCGDVSLYKGFVPQENLLEISKFKLKEEDITVSGICWDSGTPRIRYSISKKKFMECSSAKAHKFEWAESKELGLPFKYFDQIRENTLKICAPIKDMDTKNMKLNGYHLEKHIPDPIVLQPIEGGYLIISKWGDEASDPIVVNEKMN